MHKSAMAPQASAPMAAPGGPSGGGAPAPVTEGAADAPKATQIPEQMIVEGGMSLEVDEIGNVVPELRAFVTGLGGRVINESVAGAELSWSATLKLRVPPDKVEDVADWLGKHGEVTAKHISATDVSKQMFDEELAIKNLKTTLDRLTQLMATPNMQVAQILQIEQEMTRIRGQIEALEGDERFLKDRVGLATLDVSISRKSGAVTVAKATVYPGARATTLVLFDPRGKVRTRFGGGLVMHTALRNFSIEADIFQKEHDEPMQAAQTAVVATVGGATYSDFLGRGQRPFLNPYLGLRLGYAYLDGSKFVVQGEAGVELWKSKYVLLDASVRGTAMFGSATDIGVIGGLGAVFAF